MSGLFLYSAFLQFCRNVTGFSTNLHFLWVTYAQSQDEKVCWGRQSVHDIMADRKSFLGLYGEWIWWVWEDLIS
jgi:hypothetical protein